MGLYIAIAAVGLAVIAYTAWMTASEYENLPDRLPLSFWVDGTPTGYGPRSAIWVVPIVQLLIAGDIAFVVQFPSHPMSGRDHLGVGIATLCIFGLTAFVQKLLLETAQTPDQRLRLKRFWLPFIVSVGIIIASAIYL